MSTEYGDAMSSSHPLTPLYLFINAFKEHSVNRMHVLSAIVCTECIVVIKPSKLSVPMDAGDVD